MAAIVPTNLAVKNVNGQRYAVVRAAVAQADAGQTDWIWVPAWAKAMVVYLNVSAVAGTTPNIISQVVTSDPILMNTSTGGAGTANGACLGAAALTGGITSAGNVNATYMAGETGIADKTVVGASGATTISVNASLPQFVGLRTVLFRGSSDETYSYTLGVEFFGRAKTQRGAKRL